MITGTILAYSIDVDAGVIKGADGRAYFFTNADWINSEVKPANDMKIAFIPSRGRAFQVKHAA